MNYGSEKLLVQSTIRAEKVLDFPLVSGGKQKPFIRGEFLLKDWRLHLVHRLNKYTIELVMNRKCFNAANQDE